MADNEPHMLQCLNQNFETDEKGQGKVTVDEVKRIFQEKFPGTTNTLFGKVVRKAFPGITRSRDSVCYYYTPLKWRLECSSIAVGVTLGDMTGIESLCKSTQTKVETPPTKEVLQQQLADLKTKIKTLERHNALLKSTLKELHSKNDKRQASDVGTTKRKASKKDAQRSSNKKARLQDVNLINSEELVDLTDNDLIGEGTFVLREDFYANRNFSSGEKHEGRKHG